MQTTSTPCDDVLLEARGIEKSFAGARALDGSSIVVRRSRCVALLGENGAGKSTLMNILTGALAPDAGEIRVHGRLASFRSPRDAQRVGIAIVHQELALAPNLTVAENIFLGREPRNRWGLIDRPRMNAAAQRLVNELHVSLDPAVIVARLRVGAQQLVEIAKALSLDAQVLILDEPTSALSDQEAQSLLGVIRRLKQRGVGIVYITHRLDELPFVADDVTVLRDGRHIVSCPHDGMTRDAVVQLIVGRDLKDQVALPQQELGDVAISVQKLSLKRGDRTDEFAVRDVSLAVRRGEILGVFGLLGAGRTELLETMFGMHARRRSGAIVIGGRETPIACPADAIRAGIALAPEDRKESGLVMAMSVQQNAVLASGGRVSHWGVISNAKERLLARQFAERLYIKTASLANPVATLSGGNQQKVVLAKCLATQPYVLLLDEPTRGIDVGARHEIYELITGLARDGMAILLASSELPELLALADRIVVMAEGRLTAEYTRAEATEQQLLHAALPAGRLDRGRVA